MAAQTLRLSTVFNAAETSPFIRTAVQMSFLPSEIHQAQIWSHAPRARVKPPSSERVVKTYPIIPNSRILSVIGSTLLGLLWDVIVGRTEDMMV